MTRNDSLMEELKVARTTLHQTAFEMFFAREEYQKRKADMAKAKALVEEILEVIDGSREQPLLDAIENAPERPGFAVAGNGQSDQPLGAIDPAPERRGFDLVTSRPGNGPEADQPAAKKKRKARSAPGGHP